MRRRVILCLIAVLCAITANADGVAFRNPSGYWGLRASYNITIPGKYTLSPEVVMDVFKPGSGVEIGVTRMIPIVSGLYVEPGAMFFLDRYSVRKDRLHIFYNSSTAMSYSKSGCRVPVMIGWRFSLNGNTKLGIFTGPELEIGFSGKLREERIGGDSSHNLYSTGRYISLREFPFLWRVGAGVSFKKYYLGVSGSFGLSNMHDYVITPSYHENHINVTLGLNLNTYHRKKCITESEPNPNP